MDDDCIGFMPDFINGLSFSFSYLVDCFFGHNVAKFCNGVGCDRLIAGDHDDLNSCRPAFKDGEWDCVSRGVGERKNPDKALAVEFKVGFFVVELESFGVFIFGKMILCKS